MNPHLQPWNVSPDDFPADGFASDQLEFLLRYAILAPSNYNSQPWLFRINAMDVEICADRRRASPVTDPNGRELTLSCGAAIFNLRVAAEYFGHVYKTQLIPDLAVRDLLARFHLGLRGETEADNIVLFSAMTQRRTNRQPFLEDPVPPELLEELVSLAAAEGAWFQVAGPEQVRAALADLVSEADKIQWADKRFREELAKWVRTKPDLSRDGLPVSTAGVRDWLSFAGPALIRTFDRGGGQAARDRDIALQSPVLAVLGTDQDTPEAWLMAGQALQRILLRARIDDVWASFLNQPIEVSDLRGRVGEALGRPGFPQVLLRLGYAEEVTPTPRRFVRETLILHTPGH
jgi:nitroreductase